MLQLPGSRLMSPAELLPAMMAAALQLRRQGGLAGVSGIHGPLGEGQN
jgi:hypothetical protein